MVNLSVGDRALAFEAINQRGEMIKLSDYLGKKVILYFYPRDNTPGCTAQACNLNDNYSELIDNGFEVIGISPDSIESHMKFATKFNLAFNLIADTEKKILKAYGAWGEKKMYGKTYEGVLRKTFVINEKGVITTVVDKVKTKTHFEQLMSLL
ncbi:MAG: thioredoxin-dependent thiol peroxidase [Salinivirgaceae bacterium]|nr:thioredoxin-dependent thiol peroxidase [Salinivirgaceae bacterium]MDD4746039.1 thioredoxin-dependent thiol peroxidase [Salinivirgaceae bacterium]MDY0281595.1 thioredoxin-dependent thiol peroxidase [Salinivirgaceae bacterium]